MVAIHRSVVIFLKEKLDLKNVMVGLITNLKIKCNIQVQYLCCNNVGGNVDFKRAWKHGGMGMEIEYTALGTPQQNSCIEWKFVTLFNWVYTMLNSGKFTAFLRNNLISHNRDLSPFQHFLGEGRRIILYSVC